MSSEESNKTLKKTPSQDSNSEIEWDLDELKDSIKRSAEEQWDAFLDSTGQYGNPSAELQWEAEKKRWRQQYNHEES